jgi:hypothetical protein
METIPEPPPAFDARAVARVVACGRIAVGVGLTVLPGVAGGGWFGPVAKQPATKAAIRALGVRDALMGVGTLRALERGDEVRPWIIGCGIADAVDAAATLLAWGHLPKRKRLLALAVAAGAAASAVVLADQVDG